MTRLVEFLSTLQKSNISSLKQRQLYPEESIKEYVLDRALPYTEDEKGAMRELKEFLNPRIKQAEGGKFSGKTFDDIKKEAYARRHRK